MRRLSQRINWRTSLCLQSLMAMCCFYVEGEKERKKCPVWHRARVRACDAQRARLNLQHCANRLSAPMWSVGTVPVCLEWPSIHCVLRLSSYLRICQLSVFAQGRHNLWWLRRVHGSESALLCQWHKLSHHCNFPVASCHISTVPSIPY